MIISVQMQQGWGERELLLAMVVGRDTRQDPRMAPMKVEEANNLCQTWKEFIAVLCNIVQKAILN